MTRMIDLHVHTDASDGTLSPSETVNLACKAGLVAMAVTDHDTVGGVKEAVDASIGTRLELVPGVEISVGDTDNVHIIGLYVDIENADFKNKMQLLKKCRDDRNNEIIFNLQKQGIDITIEDVKSITNAKNVGRLHIAQYLCNKGYVKDYRRAFKKYLVPGSKTYSPIKHLSEQEGIETILNSGGIPFLAHINYLKQDEFGVENTIKRLMGYGLMGVEVLYSGYNKEDENLAKKICQKYNLLKSGGTDFHGARRPGVYLGTGRGNLCVPFEFLTAIKEKIR